ncbi:SDR family NAD(P)-dependent oxidoreductase [Algoriphagus sediminis]|uniref:SDR family oxidoreductase n=1 Tax=Algoriphagus sediminis TaxID=3057113 RepID=A0ABT7YC39_9BACT|nr:SDR family oxidoreductase [Algoriphagus sediminis]MDN3204095.1 SDR family oxidoreductase [Algoriphagus sediminis]
MKLQNRTFIVTGATSGMGRAIALEFSKEGAKLILSGRNEEAAEKLLKLLKTEAYFLAGDVSDPAYNQRLVELALDKFGKLDGLVTNAGMLGLGSITELEIEKWTKTLDVNLTSVFYLLKSALPYLENSNYGSVVINSSIAAFKSFPNHPSYCASKAGLVALSKQAAVDYAPKVRINCICPGPVDTPFIHASAAAFPDPATAVENAGKNTLVQRLGEPEDIAKLALFLASEDASWITGGVYTIDGGIMAKG